jgi:hypothetical protein
MKGYLFVFQKSGYAGRIFYRKTGTGFEIIAYFCTRLLLKKPKQNVNRI